MPTITVDTSQCSAAHLIDAMKVLLAFRKRELVTRRKFLKQWRILRLRLFLTREYQLFREAVIVRAGGACETCGEVGNHVHHMKPVAYYPEMVLDPDHARYLCRPCHRSSPEHRSPATHSEAPLTLPSSG